MVSGRLAARMVHTAVMEEQVNWAIDADIRDFHSRALLASAYCRSVDSRLSSLSGDRLTQIDDGIAREMARRDLARSFGARQSK